MVEVAVLEGRTGNNTGRAGASAWRWSGVAASVAGALTLVWGAFGPVEPNPFWPPDHQRFWVVALVVVLLVLASRLWSLRRQQAAQQAWGPQEASLDEATRQVRFVAAVAVVLALALLGMSAHGWSLESRTGWPSAVPLWHGLGALVVLAGVVLLVVPVPHPASGLAGNRRLLTRAAALLVPALAVAAGGVAIESTYRSWPVHHTTVAGQPVPGRPLPATLTRVGWTQTLARGAVVATGPQGVLVNDGSTVRVLEARSGRTLWSYGRDGACLVRAAFNAAGDAVVVTPQPRVSADGTPLPCHPQVGAGRGEDLTGWQVVLDAGSGQFSYVGPDVANAGPGRGGDDGAALVSGAWALREDVGHRLVQTDLGTGHELTLPLDPSCLPARRPDAAFATPTGWVLEEICGEGAAGRVTLRSVDHTGRQAWRADVPAGESDAVARATVLGDRLLLQVDAARTPSSTVFALSTGRVLRRLDTFDAALVTPSLLAFRPDHDPGAEVPTRVLDLATGAVRTLTGPDARPDGAAARSATGVGAAAPVVLAGGVLTSAPGPGGVSHVDGQDVGAEDYAFTAFSGRRSPLFRAVEPALFGGPRVLVGGDVVIAWGQERPGRLVVRGLLP
ncbi:hypothetical protein FB474_2106 [Oryzihumus leptocrescens]|uniref:Uncharacterized protein n=1 Tax=Oryzihumus leptocrescens TaxID=297536 RepID=A0A542ZK82_9MICO|nr:hypothetical protein FB474_2106 [Oryzihumus leptocrescens]